MIERVARAICAAKGDDPDEPCEDWMTEFSGWRGYQESARAAIEAMRDPTEAMIEAGAMVDNWCQSEGQAAQPDVYRKMIDEALK